MIIPTSFEIAGLTIHIQIDNNSIREKNFIGMSDFPFQRIVLDKTTMPRQTTEQALFHEIVHWILYVQNEHELRNNEKFVDQFAHLLYQVLSSGKMLKENEDHYERYLCPNCCAALLAEKLPMGSEYGESLPVGCGADDGGTAQADPEHQEEAPDGCEASDCCESGTRSIGRIEGGDHAQDECFDRCPQYACPSCGGARDGDQNASHRQSGDTLK